MGAVAPLRAAVAGVVSEARPAILLEAFPAAARLGAFRLAILLEVSPAVIRPEVFPVVMAGVAEAVDPST